MTPREIVRQIEAEPAVPCGAGDRFSGYAVIGLPFRSGHVLALRRFPASSVGPGYTSIWHRDPRGSWTFYSTVPPDLGCSRYFGGEITRNVVAPIAIEWISASAFRVSIGDELLWEVTLTESVLSRSLNMVSSLLPVAAWQSGAALKVIGGAARICFGTGKLNLSGKTPNGQAFLANPRRLWLIDGSRAIVSGRDLGPPGPLARQANLRDFFIPQRGLFAVAQAFLSQSGSLQPHAEQMGA